MDNTSQKAEAYGKAVDDALIDTVRLVSSSFRVSPSFRSDDENLRRSVRHKLSAPKYDEATGSLVGLVHCQCWMDKKDASPDGKKPGPNLNDEGDHLLLIKASYALMFRLSSSHDANVVKVFFERMAALTVWPYFRIHVASIAAEAGINIPILPIKKLVHRVKAAENYVDPEEQ